MGVVMLEEFDEVVEVVCIESPVFKIFEGSQVSWFGMQTEIVRAHIHFIHQVPGFVDDGGAVSPGENGGEKSCDLDVLFLSEQVRDAYRVIENKGLINMCLQLLIQKIFKGFHFAHSANIRL